MNFFNATLRKDGEKLFVDGGTFNVQVPENRVGRYVRYADKPVIFGIRPEDIHNPEFAPPSITPQEIEAVVDVTELMGNEIFVYLKTGEQIFVARVDPRSRYHINDKVRIDFNMDNMHLFDRDTEETIR
jgi:multiple sugar transport system ATP-binding protein